MEFYKKQSASEKLEVIKTPSDLSGVWVNMFEEKLDPVYTASKFDLDENSLRDTMDVHELSRAEFVGGVEYVFLRIPSIERKHNSSTVPLLIAVNKKRFFTISAHEFFSPKLVEDFLITSTERPQDILTATFAGIVSQYEAQIRKIWSDIHSARQRLNSYVVHNSDFIKFVSIENALNEYKSSLEGINSVVVQLQQNKRKMFSAGDNSALEDVRLHIQQLLVSISSGEQTVSSIQSAYSTISNNVLNQRMRSLTMVTILLAIPNVFYGMYGMNVDLPFQHERWAYSLIISVTLLLLTAVYMVVKRGNSA